MIGLAAPTDAVTERATTERADDLQEMEAAFQRWIAEPG